MGLLGNAYNAVAGAADKATGKVDESVGRQFDSTPGGGLADQAADFTTTGDALNDGQDDFKLSGAPKQVMDTAFQYEDGTLFGMDASQYEDKVDTAGPTVDQTKDAASGITNTLGTVYDQTTVTDKEKNNSNPLDNVGPKLWFYGLIVVGLLFLLRPFAELGANATEGA